MCECNSLPFFLDLARNAALSHMFLFVLALDVCSPLDDMSSLSPTLLVAFLAWCSCLACLSWSDLWSLPVFALPCFTTLLE